MRNKMKALVTLLLCLVTVLAFGLLLTACGETDESGTNPGGGGEVVTPGGGEDNPGGGEDNPGGGGTAHTHTPDNVWHVDSTAGTHYHECTVCHERVDEAEHVEETIPEVKATCTQKGKTAGKKCSVCDTILEEQTETDMIAHTPDGVYVPTETGHYQKCSVCETELPEEEHVVSEDAEIQYTDEVHFYVCELCEAHVEEEEHIPGTVYHIGENGHYHKCVECKRPFPEEDHIESTDERAKYVKLSEDGFHKIQCVCGADIVEKEACTYTYIEGEGSAPNNTTHTVTCKCGRHDYPKHTPVAGDEGDYFTTDTQHYQLCSVCNHEYNREDHMIKKSGKTGEGTLISADMENHTFTCHVCQKTVTGKHKEFVYKQLNNNGPTYDYECEACRYRTFTFHRRDDVGDAEEYGVSTCFSSFGSDFPADSKEFELTLPSSFTINGVEKKVTSLQADTGTANVKLTKLVVPEEIKIITGSVQSFQYLKTIVLLGVETAYQGVFHGNPALTTIVIPKSLNEIKNGNSLVYSGDPKPTAYFLGSQAEWKSDLFDTTAFKAIKYYGTDWHWEDESKKDTPVDGAKPVALLPTMITTTQARKREI